VHGLGCAFIVLAVLAYGSSAAGQPQATDGAAARQARVVEAGREQTTRTQIQLGAVYEHLSNGYSPWRSASLELRAGGARGKMHVVVEETSRFSQRDHNVTFGIERHLAPGWILSAEAQASPSHRVSATWGARGEIAYTTGTGWGLHASLLHRTYTSASVDLATMSVERYVSRYRAAYSLSAARLHGGGMSTSHRVQGDLYYGSSSSSVGASVSVGEELENVAPFGVLRTDVRGAAVVGRQWIHPTWFVTYDAVVHDQGDFYTRCRASVGIGYRF
jgi:YaiO family outer membrane protein